MMLKPVSEPPTLATPEPKQTMPGSRTGTVLNIFALLALAFGGFIFLNAKSAVHEIEAAIAFLCFICAIGFAGVINELRSARK